MQELVEALVLDKKAATDRATQMEALAALLAGVLSFECGVSAIAVAQRHPYRLTAVDEQPDGSLTFTVEKANES